MVAYSGISSGGIGIIYKMVQSVGLPEEINSRLELLKRHLPYHESDHSLNIVFNILAGGTCLDDIELLRNNESYLSALGAQCQRSWIQKNPDRSRVSGRVSLPAPKMQQDLSGNRSEKKD
jgi:hypothetical protein